MSEHIGTYQWIPHNKVAEHVARGWRKCRISQKTSHDYYCVLMEAPDGFDVPLVCQYTNWKGETRERRLIPVDRPRYGTSEWHKEPTWLLPCIDVDTGKRREFDMTKIVPKEKSA